MKRLKLIEKRIVFKEILNISKLKFLNNLFNFAYIKSFKKQNHILDFKQKKKIKILTQNISLITAKEFSE